MSSDGKEPMDLNYAQLASKLQISLSREFGSRVPITSFFAPEIKLEDSGVIVNYHTEGKEQQKYGLYIRFNDNNCNYLFSTYPLNRFEVVKNNKSRHMNKDEYMLFKSRVLSELTDEQKIELKPILRILDLSFNLSLQKDKIARDYGIHEHYNPNRRCTVDRSVYEEYDRIYRQLKEISNMANDGVLQQTGTGTSEIINYEASDNNSSIEAIGEIRENSYMRENNNLNNIAQYIKELDLNLDNDLYEVHGDAKKAIDKILCCTSEIINYEASDNNGSIEAIGKIGKNSYIFCEYRHSESGLEDVGDDVSEHVSDEFNVFLIPNCDEAEWRNDRELELKYRVLSKSLDQSYINGKLDKSDLFDDRITDKIDSFFDMLIKEKDEQLTNNRESVKESNSIFKKIAKVFEELKEKLK